MDLVSLLFSFGELAAQQISLTRVGERWSTTDPGVAPEESTLTPMGRGFLLESLDLGVRPLRIVRDFFECESRVERSTPLVVQTELKTDRLGMDTLAL